MPDVESTVTGQRTQKAPSIPQSRSRVCSSGGQLWEGGILRPGLEGTSGHAALARRQGTKD